MYVCMYVCMYVFMCLYLKAIALCMYVCMYVRMYITVYAAKSNEVEKQQQVVKKEKDKSIIESFSQMISDVCMYVSICM